MEVTMTTFNSLIEQANTALAVKRVFGEPYEKNGVTVITAARIVGGMGGGEGEGMPGSSESGPEVGRGSGGGFGMLGGPAGAYVIKGDSVSWVPAIDVNRLLFGFQVVMIVFFLTVRSIARARAKAKL
jgi:uncharacterized spore protein YtfJ